MPAVEVGSPAINRAVTGAAGYSALLQENPASSKILISIIKVWANTNITGLKVGSHYLVSGTNYKCRAAVTIGSVTAGSEQTFTAPTDFTAFIMESGDYISAYYSAGKIEASATGYAGVPYIAGDHLVVDDEASFTGGAGDTASLQGLGSPLVEFAGVAASTTVTAGAMKNTLRFAGVCAGATVTAAAMKNTLRFAGSAAGATITAGAMKNTLRFAGVCVGTTVTAAALTVYKWFAGVCAGSTITAAALKRTRKFAGICAGSTVTSGSIGRVIGLAGSCAGSTVTSCFLFLTHAAIRNLAVQRLLAVIRTLTPLR